MDDIVHALQAGSGNLWLFIPTAILLGALHGLEPGHSKTLMAAFIVAIRGTIGQAVLLGVSAAISHSLIIWLLAALALHYGNQWNSASLDAWLQLASAVIIFGLAAWMYLRTRRDIHDAGHHHHHHGHDHDHDHDHDHHHDHGHDHDHHHHSENFLLDLGHGKLELSVFEEGVPPVFQLRAPAGQRLPAAADVTIETVRPDGAKQTFKFTAKKDFLESTTDIPEPHEFDATLTLGHGSHHHTALVEFREDAHHHHHGAAEVGEAFQDEHERAHAEDIARRFQGRTVTTPQIILFGVTGGLMPCPAAFTVLLVCLQLKRVSLGFALVASFSFGLALTMVAVGMLAAWSVRHAERKFSGFGEIMRRAPYVSCVLLVLLAAFMGWHGWEALNSPVSVHQ